MIGKTLTLFSLYGRRTRENAIFCVRNGKKVELHHFAQSSLLFFVIANELLFMQMQSYFSAKNTGADMS